MRRLGQFVTSYPGQGVVATKPRLVVRFWTHPIRSEAVKYCL